MGTPSRFALALVVGDVSPGAFGNLAGALSRGFGQLGHDVEIAFIKGTAAPERFHPDVRFVPLAASRSLSSVPALRRYLRATAADIVISLGWLQNAAVAVALPRRGRPRTFILSEHGHMAYEARVEHGDKLLFRSMPRIARRFYPRADGLVAVDEEVLESLVDDVGLDSKHLAMTVVPNPVDGDLIRSLASAERRDRVGEPIVASVGRLAPQKNHALLLEAFARIADATRARLVLVGDGPLRDQLERRAADLGIRTRVQFTGQVSNPYPYMQQARVFVLPSLKEGFPLALLEALALGSAVVASSCSHGPVEILEEGRSGVLVPPGDADALGRAIADLLEDDARRESLVSRARRRSGDFAPAVVAQRWLDFVAQLRDA